MIQSVFIIGIPRSGTTWLLSILSNHPDCRHVSAEMLGIKTKYSTLETGLFLRGFDDNEILKRWDNLPKNKILIEKTPGHIFETSRIKRLLNPKIILIKRNCLDVLTSMLHKNNFWPESPKTLDEAMRLYKSFDLPLNRIKYDYIINYEDLWSNPVIETNKIFQFLGLRQDQTEKIIKKTSFGYNLSKNLKTIFRKGVPKQGQNYFTLGELNKIKKIII